MKQQYLSAAPYPHVSVDGLFDERVLDGVVAEFPDPETMSIKYDNKREVKRGSGSEAGLPLFTRTFIRALNSATFIDFLEAVTGVDGLVPDPHLVGGGLHALPRGGKLSLHTDFNYHEKLRLHRRINVLIYLNRDWLEEYGGEFQAWRPNGSDAEARYLPLFNRTVIFNTNDYTFHGNPDPVTCPEGWVRRSIALYYYTNGRPKDEWTGLREGTIFMNRPGEDVVEKRSFLRTQLLRIMPIPLRGWIRAQRKKWAGK